MDFSEAADRISRKFQKSGQTIDPKKIEGKLRRLIEEFSVQPSEAERSVTNELAKEFNIQIPGHGTSKNGNAPEEATKIAELYSEQWATIVGKVISVSKPNTPSIAQSGVIADSTGAIGFVVWTKANADLMETGKWYQIESAIVDEYKGVAGLKIHSGSTIKLIESDESFSPAIESIADLSPGIGCVRAKVVQVWDATHERMLQSGLLGDKTGTIKFVIWKEPGKESLTLGSMYNIFYAHVDEYNGRLSLNLNTAMIMAEEGSIETKGREVKITDATPDEWVAIKGKVVALTTSASQEITQSGIIADDSGGMEFISWANSPTMKKDAWYRIDDSAWVDKYKGRNRLNISSATHVEELDTDEPLKQNTIPIKDLHIGVSSVRAKVVQIWDASHERMLQSGLLGDETGTIKFVTWKEPGKEEKLVQGSVYNISYAIVDEYNGKLSLNLNNARITLDYGNIEIKSDTDEISGAVVHISPGSGLIKRCPVEGCNRTLSRQNYCPIHEIQPKFVYDLRIKGWLDDGVKTYNLLMKRGTVESLTGITLDDAIKIADTNPLGLDEVFGRMREKVLGRYLVCIGREFEERFIVGTCAPKIFKSEEHTALLNIAGGAS